MLHGIERSGFQDVHHVIAQLDGSTHKHVDMAIVELVRVFVVGAEHQFVGMGSHQWDQSLKILGGTTFTDENLHAEADLLQSTRYGEALVIGGDAHPHIALQVVAGHRRCMAVDRLVVSLGCGNLTHHLGVFIDDARVVHHLREVVDVGRGHQFLDVIGVEGKARGLKGRGRHTTRGTEEELERHLFAVFDHIADTFLAEHVGNFVRVADGGHRAMTDRQTRKFGRHQHGTLHMHMGINKARHDILRVAYGLLFDLGDFAIFDDDDARENP